jgi:hypothetical protein
MSLYDLKIGDPVVIYRSFRNSPPDQGEVVKIGRKLITVKCGFFEEQFRLESGQLNSRDYPYHAHIKTLDQAREDDYRLDLEKDLHERGIRFDVATKRLSVNVLEKFIQALKDDE